MYHPLRKAHVNADATIRETAMRRVAGLPMDSKHCSLRPWIGGSQLAMAWKPLIHALVELAGRRR